MKNDVIIITGAAMGLGLAAAKECAAKGAKLVLVDYNEKELKSAHESLKEEHSELEAITVVADVSDEAAVKGYVDEAVNAFGKIDGFI